jgi:hypothetical protein
MPTAPVGRQNLSTRDQAKTIASNRRSHIKLAAGARHSPTSKALKIEAKNILTFAANNELYAPPSAVITAERTCELSGLHDREGSLYFHCNTDIRKALFQAQN